MHHAQVVHGWEGDTAKVSPLCKVPEFAASPWLLEELRYHMPEDDLCVDCVAIIEAGLSDI